MKELKLEAEKYAESQKMEGFDTQMRRETFTRYSLNKSFIAGATSKYVEKQKLEFAIEQLREFKQHYEEKVGTGKLWSRIQELEQKLNQL